MKKILFILLLILSFNVMATSGSISSKTVFECNGKYYGSHGNPKHFHEVIKKDDKWVINSGEVEVPSCYIRPINETEEVSFSKCVDGDTAKLIIKEKEETVRFLAINTPEVKSSDKEGEPYGKEASDFTCNALKNAQKIVLEYDANSDARDKYNRVLAFVFIDGNLLEQELIKNGLAKVAYIYGDYNYVDILREEEEKAKTNKVGIWSDILPDVSSEESKDQKTDGNDNVTKEDLLDLLEIIWNYIIKIFDLFVK